MNSLLRYLVATPQHKEDSLNIRRWYIFYALYMIAICGLSHWGYLHYSETGDLAARTVWFLGLYVFYFSLACTHIPLPTAWLILLLASPYGGLAMLPPAQRVAMVAGLGALATGVSHLNEYHLVTYLLRLGKIRFLRHNRIYLFAEKQFRIWPFMLQVVFNILPIPADPSRWLAIMSSYPRGKFFLAQSLGRLIRYGILAIVAGSLELTPIQILLLSAFFIVSSAAVMAFRMIQQRKLKPALIE